MYQSLDDSLSPKGKPNRNLSAREILGAFSVLAAVVAGLTLGAFGYRWAAYLAVATVAMVGVRGIRSMTPKQKADMAAHIEAQEKSAFGRILQFFQLLAYLALGLAAVKWLADRW